MFLMMSIYKLNDAKQLTSTLTQTLDDTPASAYINANQIKWEWLSHPGCWIKLYGLTEQDLVGLALVNATVFTHREFTDFRFGKR